MKQLRSREQAEAALADLGRVEATLAGLEAQAKEQTQEITDRLARDRRPLDRQAAEIKRVLEAWAEANLDGRKSMKLTTGRLGWRTGKARIVRLLSLKNAVIRIKAAGSRYAHCLKVEEKPDLNALANLGNETLKELGFKRLDGERRFFAAPEGDFEADASW